MKFTDVEKRLRTQSRKKYSMLVPTWNNLPYLKNFLNSVKEHSTFDHQIILLINEGTDGTYEWVKEQADIDYVRCKENIGICYGLNICRSLIQSDYVLYANDDMYMLPGWDAELDKEITSIGHKHFMISSTMIEPTDTGNPCVIVSDYGDDLNNFRKKALLSEYKNFKKQDWSGTTWPPNLMHVDMWDAIGGMSIEFSPGMYSDPDLAMKLWMAGVRYFKGVASSRVYHYGSKSTGRVKKNLGRKMFINKWGMSAKVFTGKYLKRGEPFTGELKDPDIKGSDELKNKFKRILNA